MNIKELIMLSDIYAPKAYADYQETEWGILFYDANNPTMHDANHACILNEQYFEAALEEIKSFYLSQGLVPRIYLAGSQHRDFKALMNGRGFKVRRFGNFQHFLLSEKCMIEPSAQLMIRELKSKNDITEKLLDNLYGAYLDEEPDAVSRKRNLLKRAVRSKACRLFCGFFNNEPVCIAMLVKTQFGMYCLDFAETAHRFRGRGFARELVAYVTQQCDHPAFLYSENPTAIRIYQEAGFRRIKISAEPCFYRAVYTSNKNIIE